MKKIRYSAILPFLLLLLGIYACEESATTEYKGSWKKEDEATNSAIRRYSAAGFTIHNNIYLTTGVNESFLSNLWCYDVVEKQWSEKTGFSGAARSQAVGFANGGYGFVGLGQSYDNVLQDTTYYSDFYRYNPDTDQWNSIAPFPGMPRSKASSFVIADTAYIVGGLDTLGQVINDFWQYDIKADTWQNKEVPPFVGRYDALSFVVENKAYFGTGTTDGLETLKDFWCYDTEKKEWKKIASPQNANRLGGFAFNIDTLGYIGGGWNKGELLNDMQMYYPKKDKWYQRKSMPGNGRMHTLAFGMDAYAIIATSFNEYNLWIFQP